MNSLSRLCRHLYGLVEADRTHRAGGKRMAWKEKSAHLEADEKSGSPLGLTKARFRKH